MNVLLVVLAICLQAQASVFPRQVYDDGPSNNSSDITLRQLSTILTITNSSCDPGFPDGCRNATQALPFINQAFATYNISSMGEKAALLGLMIFESGGFKYDRNHFPPPGNPGQGTRNLMNFPFVCAYAQSQPNTSSAMQSMDPNICSSPDVDDETKNNILSLVLPDELSFASAAWFYTKSGPNGTGCTEIDGMISGLQSQTQAGWEKYITQCLFTTVTDDRLFVWAKTLEVISTPDQYADSTMYGGMTASATASASSVTQPIAFNSNGAFTFNITFLQVSILSGLGLGLML